MALTQKQREAAGDQISRIQDRLERIASRVGADASGAQAALNSLYREVTAD